MRLGQDLCVYGSCPVVNGLVTSALSAQKLSGIVTTEEISPPACFVSGATAIGGSPSGIYACAIDDSRYGVCLMGLSETQLRVVAEEFRRAGLDVRLSDPSDRSKFVAVSGACDPRIMAVGSSVVATPTPSYLKDYYKELIDRCPSGSTSCDFGLGSLYSTWITPIESEIRHTYCGKNEVMTWEQYNALVTSGGRAAAIEAVYTEIYAKWPTSVRLLGNCSPSGDCIEGLPGLLKGERMPVLVAGQRIHVQLTGNNTECPNPLTPGADAHWTVPGHLAVHAYGTVAPAPTALYYEDAYYVTGGKLYYRHGLEAAIEVNDITKLADLVTQFNDVDWTKVYAAQNLADTVTAMNATLTALGTRVGTMQGTRSGELGSLADALDAFIEKVGTSGSATVPASGELGALKATVTQLRADLDAEATARTNGIAAEATARTNGIGAEARERVNGDEAGLITTCIVGGGVVLYATVIGFRDTIFPPKEVLRIIGKLKIYKWWGLASEERTVVLGAIKRENEAGHGVNTQNSQVVDSNLKTILTEFFSASKGSVARATVYARLRRYQNNCVAIDPDPGAGVHPNPDPDVDLEDPVARR